ncbi:MAG: glycerol-3-phosphate 1-O-acyltransferase PlsY [Candidatus Omnitrophica bacterium]|nr:glycerol-3-phosphate 1-O-acyltransferase PlsY [Candidatus Omnitrophota bacterium]
MISLILAVICAYIIGSIPTAYVFGKVLRGIDIREHGSGNVGATNVVRTIGKVPGRIVFVVDFFKGFAVVTLLPLVFQQFAPFSSILSYKYFYFILGTAAICGHIWTVFLRFKGGKGVSTTMGVVAGLAPLVFILCVVVWVIVFFATRYVSVASIIAAVSLPLFAVITDQNIDFVVFCAVLTMVGVYSHRTNIKRLIQGKESKS